MQTAIFGAAEAEEGWIISAIDYGGGEDVAISYATVNSGE